MAVIECALADTQMAFTPRFYTRCGISSTYMPFVSGFTVTNRHDTCSLFVALCVALSIVLCNTKRDRDAVTPSWLDSIPGRERRVCEWVYFKDFFFFSQKLIFFSLSYMLSPSLCMDISLDFS